ncbi:hypothetical protein [Brevibacillus sp. DP1.3A]|uniref:hypothetical protein n=1 Tax=Brevibacillus sp. DP1.3A TaxID=2738867 RepID=UPI00156B706A|nr:hypothetical protein [Brevibacillus sp. DP1.3A]UED72219.1 hypothetical protein HP399_015735 [Brevibacillus sp. DP1.3A]
MSQIKSRIKDILIENSKALSLESEFESNSLNKWNKVVLKWLRDKKQYSRFKNFLFISQNILAFVSLLISFFIRNIQPVVFAYIILILSGLLIFFVNLVYKFYPDDYDKFEQEVKNLKLISLSERLAAKLAIFDKLNDHDIIDDREIIDQISYRVKAYEEMDESVQEVVKNCINPISRFSSSRETNVRLNYDDLDLSEEEKIKLCQITMEISGIAQDLFGGKGYTSKLYLRSIKKFRDEEVEALVAFSRFPIKEDFGSSWIKSRGNLSSVWECLEKGHEKIVDISKEGLYYKSFLAICLPGRIGVLAIHNEDNDVFENNVGKLECKALALVTRQLIIESLDLKTL